jgi:hypothetical protein
VDQDDVVGTDEREQLFGIAAQHLLVVAALGIAESTTVSRGPVEAVMDALRDLEEVSVALDH